jgi:membrane fusion protein, multidrug efflux system
MRRHLIFREGEDKVIRIRCRVWMLAILSGTILLGLSGCSDRLSGSGPDPSKTGGVPAVPVTVGEVTRETVPLELSAIGNVQAYTTVAIKSQVNGQLMKVHFREGQEVRKGEVLFTIDPRPFQAALKQAEGMLARDQAQLKQSQANVAKDLAQAKNAETDARRYEDLQAQGIIAKQQADQLRTSADALQAAVDADRAAVENAQAAIQSDMAAVENARLQLNYCTILSPIDGRTGNLAVYAGNLVKANDNPVLVTIHQIHPIYVSFSVPEQYLAQIKRFKAQNKLKVLASFPDEEKLPEEGELAFIDNSVDTTTGTIQLKGTFRNVNSTLWPGQFVNVVLRLTDQPNVLVVPSPAIQTGQQGQFVFVVKPDFTVDSRPITVNRTLGDKAIVAQGLTVGERVVTDGQLRLTSGSKISIKTGGLTPRQQESTR